MLLWIHAPKNFRPSNWVDMLRDVDVAFDLHPHLVDPCYAAIGGERHYVLQVMCTLLDPSSPQRANHEALFKEMIHRAAAVGLQVTVPSDFPDAFPVWWEWLQAYCAEENVTLQTHPMELPPPQPTGEPRV